MYNKKLTLSNGVEIPQKPSYTLYLEFFDKLNGLFEEWIKKI